MPKPSTRGRRHPPPRHAPSAPPATPSSDSLQLRGALAASDETPGQPAASEHPETPAPDAAEAAPADAPARPPQLPPPRQPTRSPWNALRELIGSKRFGQLIAAQVRSRRDRDALSDDPRLPPALGRRRRPDRARQDRDRLSAHGRRRGPRSAGLSGAGLCRRRAGSKPRPTSALTEMLLRYARHAMTGRVHYSRVSRNIEYKLGVRRRRRAEHDRVLRRSRDSARSGSTRRIRPTRRSRRKLAELRAADSRRRAAFRQRSGAALCPRARHPRHHDDRPAGADAARRASASPPSRT